MLQMTTTPDARRHCTLENVASLHFPCLLVVGGNLAFSTGTEFRKYFLLRVSDKRELILRNYGLERLKIHVIIDSTGVVRTLQPVTTKYSFMGWLSPVFDFVQGVCVIGTERSLNCGELIDVIKSLRDIHASRIVSFRAFLREQDASRVFDAELFSSYLKTIHKGIPKTPDDQILVARSP